MDFELVRRRIQNERRVVFVLSVIGGLLAGWLFYQSFVRLIP